MVSEVENIKSSSPACHNTKNKKNKKEKHKNRLANSSTNLTCFAVAYGSRGAFSQTCNELAEVLSQSSWYLLHKIT